MEETVNVLSSIMEKLIPDTYGFHITTSIGSFCTSIDPTTSNVDRLALRIFRLQLFGRKKKILNGVHDTVDIRNSLAIITNTCLSDERTFVTQCARIVTVPHFDPVLVVDIITLPLEEFRTQLLFRSILDYCLDFAQICDNCHEYSQSVGATARRRPRKEQKPLIKAQLIAPYLDGS